MFRFRQICVFTASTRAAAAAILVHRRSSNRRPLTPLEQDCFRSFGSPRVSHPRIIDDRSLSINQRPPPNKVSSNVKTFTRQSSSAGLTLVSETGTCCEDQPSKFQSSSLQVKASNSSRTRSRLLFELLSCRRRYYLHWTALELPSRDSRQGPADRSLFLEHVSADFLLLDQELMQ